MPHLIPLQYIGWMWPFEEEKYTTVLKYKNVTKNKGRRFI